MIQPTFVDLFAGAGLFSHAFVEEGFRVVQAVESDEFASRSYRANLGTVVERTDVQSTAPIGAFDVLIAGPPCQGFSTLGKRDPNDPRSWLCLELLRWVDVGEPRFVVVENVASFLDSEPCRHLLAELAGRGYHTTKHVYDAFDYGVPQRRERGFLVASLSHHPFRGAVRVGDGHENPREAWSDLPQEPDGQSLHIAPDPGELARKRMNVLPYGGDKRDIIRDAPELAAPSWLRHPNAVTDVWGRMTWDEPANTLRTCFQNASKGRYIHPEQNRVISVREGARLQTVPDDWRFVGPRTRIVSQIGNAVPPLLGRAIARGVRAIF